MVNKVPCSGLRSKAYHSLGLICSDLVFKNAAGKDDLLATYNVTVADSFGVCRSNACDGYLEKNSRGSLCSSCNGIDVRALGKRAARAQENRDKVDAVNALSQDLPMPDDIVKRYSGSKKHWSKLPKAEAILKLKASLQGLHDYSFKPSFNVERELVVYKIGAFDAPIFQEEPTLRQFVHRVESDGIMGKHMFDFMRLYAEGKVSQNAPLAGLLVGFTQHARKVEAGISNNRGIKHIPGTFNFLLGMKRWGRRAIEYVTKSTMGYAISPTWVNSEMRTQVKHLTDIEVLDPSAEDLQAISKEANAWFGNPSLSVVSVCMDATKVAGHLQFCRKRGKVVGGTVDQNAAKLSVESGTSMADLMGLVNGVAEADVVGWRWFIVHIESLFSLNTYAYMSHVLLRLIIWPTQVNVVAVSRHRANHTAVELALYPHRQARTNLPEGCGALEAFNGASEFKRMDKVLTAISEHHVPVSVGGDGGVECNQVLLFLL